MREREQLDDVHMDEEFFENTAFVGIASAAPAYRLCWLLNNHFDIDFLCETDLTLELKKNKKIYYLPVFQYLLPNSSHRYLLYKLRFGKFSVLPEAAKMDYLWMVQTTGFEKDAEKIQAELKNIPEISLSKILEKNSLKSRNDLFV